MKSYLLCGLTLAICAISVTWSVQGRRLAEQKAARITQEAAERERKEARSTLAMLEFEQAILEYQRKNVPTPLDFSARGTPVTEPLVYVRPSFREPSPDEFQSQILREMRRANDIANEALWDARLRYDPAPVVWPRESLPTTTGSFDPGEHFRQFEQQQTLQGIEYELRQLRWEHRPIYYNY